MRSERCTLQSRTLQLYRFDVAPTIQAHGSIKTAVRAWCNGTIASCTPMVPLATGFASKALAATDADPKNGLALGLKS